jgi:hypothetical protein
MTHLSQAKSSPLRIPALDPSILARLRDLRALCVMRFFFLIGLWALGAVLQQLAGLGIDTDFVYHATILDIEGIA